MFSWYFKLSNFIKDEEKTIFSFGVKVPMTSQRIKISPHLLHFWWPWPTKAMVTLTCKGSFICLTTHFKSNYGINWTFNFHIGLKNCCVNSIPAFSQQKPEKLEHLNTCVKLQHCSKSIRLCGFLLQAI